MTNAHTTTNLAKPLAESVWLAAVILIPVSTDLLASQIFSAPKTALIEIFGILSAVAIVLSWFEGEWRHARYLSCSAAPLPALAAITLWGVSVVSWLWAIDPSRTGDIATVSSLSPRHLACQISLFLSVSFFLRTAEQLQRLALAALASGFAVAAFALMQAYGLQAPGYAVVKGMAITSFVGGPIFLAGYLLMLIPLAVWNLNYHLRESRGCLSSSVTAAAIVLLVLLGAFLACDKRGPTVGLLAAFFSALVILAAAKRRYKALTTTMAVMAITGAALTGLAYLRKAGAPVDEIPYLQRLAMIVPVGGETGDSYRSNLWRLLPDFMLSKKPLLLPDGTIDAHHSLRSWFGYGPDNVQSVLPSKYLFLQAWPGEVMEVSCHSHFWDMALSLGLAGLLVFFGLFFAIWHIGLQKIGLKPLPVWPAAALTVFCAVLGGISTSLVFHPGFFGLGAQLGFLGALLCLAVWPSRGRVCSSSPASPEQLLLLAMLSALAGFWVDLGFIFPTDENSTLFWLFAGAIVGVHCPDGNFLASRSLDLRPNQSDAWATAIGSGILIAGIHARADLPSLLGGRTAIHGLFGGTSTFLLLSALALSSVWMTSRLFIGIASAEMSSLLEKNCRQIIMVGLVYLAGVVWLAQIMAWLPPSPQHPFLVDFWAVHFALFIIAGLVWTTLSITGQPPKMPFAAYASAIALALVAAVLIWRGPFQDLRSSISAGSIKCLPGARSWLERGISLRPERIRNYSLLSGLLTAESMRPELNERERLDLMDSAAEVLTRGISISEFNLMTAALGRLRLWQAMRNKEAGQSLHLAISAKSALQKATRFAPQNELAWFDAAIIEETFLGTAASAKVVREKADDTTLRAEPWQNIVEDRWGSYYLLLATRVKPDELRRAYAERSMMYWQIYLADNSEKLRQTEISEQNHQIRRGVLHDRIRALAHAGEALRILGNQIEASRLYAEGEDLCNELNQPHFPNQKKRVH
jgi:hypothetical protein